jgi:hypothetical protein
MAVASTRALSPERVHQTPMLEASLVDPSFITRAN